MRAIEQRVALKIRELATDVGQGIKNNVNNSILSEVDIVVRCNLRIPYVLPSNAIDSRRFNVSEH